jgi:hypothetical protein
VLSEALLFGIRYYNIVAMGKEEEEGGENGEDRLVSIG